MTYIRQRLAFLAGIAGLLAVTVLLQIGRDRVYAGPPDIDAPLVYIESRMVLQKVALSYSAVLADVYWVRAIQHYGSERLKPRDSSRFGQLYPLLDLTTSLDPNFLVAYRFGAIFLSEPYPGGAGQPELAIKLLKKGVELTPEKWQYYHDIGFVYFWNLHDYRSAADWFQRGGAQPGSPWWLRTYAAITAARGGDRQTSRAMWRNILATAESNWTTETAQKRLMQLDALDQIDNLRKLEEEYRRRRGRTPETWEEMMAAGLLRSVPADPSGTPYTLNFATGAIDVSGFSPLYPLPAGPSSAQP